MRPRTGVGGTVNKSGKRDSNPRPQPWQGCALPTELFPHRETHPDGPFNCVPPGPGSPGMPDCHGGEGDRTPDLLNAIQALSQLSYAPGTSFPSDQRHKSRVSPGTRQPIHAYWECQPNALAKRPISGIFRGFTGIAPQSLPFQRCFNTSLVRPAGFVGATCDGHRPESPEPSRLV